MQRAVVAAVFEISMVRCGLLLLCHRLDHNGEYFHQECPDPYSVAVLATTHRRTRA